MPHDFSVEVGGFLSFSHEGNDRGGEHRVMSSLNVRSQISFVSQCMVLCAPPPPICFYITYVNIFLTTSPFFLFLGYFFYICSGIEKLGDQCKVVFARSLHQLHEKQRWEEEEGMGCSPKQVFSKIFKTFLLEILESWPVVTTTIRANEKNLFVRTGRIFCLDPW